MKSNVEMIEVVARGLKDKLDNVVFVGGSIMELYIKDPATNKPRVTDDVDIVVEIATRSAYDQFENELRGLGFINDISGPSCRFIFNEVKVDVISTSIDTSGFTNIWYEKGFEKNFIVKVKEYQIRIFTIEYYLASKFEAYKSRGAGNLLSSHDLEDIIYIFDGTENIDEVINDSEEDVKRYLIKEIKELVENPGIKEIVTGHLGFGTFYERSERIINIFKRFGS